MTRVAALVTPQWRPTWDLVQFDKIAPARPSKEFLTFVMKASEVRRLAGVFRRTPKVTETRSSDENIQRPHESARSREIRRFVELGYPMSNMTPGQLDAADASLRRPGWLPTAVVVNILKAGDAREGMEPLTGEGAISIPNVEGLEPGAVVHIDTPDLGSAEVAGTPPIEVIDGQHRLWAFEGDESTDDYYLPVVAFIDLDRSYQAYLFWSINIKPRKINTSLAFDLYPMLRSQDWLMQGEGLKVYRESRAQELTEALWASAESPWYDRINMIGETGVADKRPVTQASFVRSLLASFVKPWDTKFIAGGAFGNSESGGLDWNRSQQAAYLVAAWQELVAAAERTRPKWFKELAVDAIPARDTVLGQHTILASDQGVRVFLLVLNEMTYRNQLSLDLGEWQLPPSGDSVDPAQVKSALEDLDRTGLRQFLRDFAESAIRFDWRTTRAPGVNAELAREKMLYRGSGGYVTLRKDLYGVLAKSPVSLIRDTATQVSRELADAEGRRS